MQAVERRIQNLPGSNNRETDLTDRNMYLQNSISAQILLKRIWFQVKHY